MSLPWFRMYAEAVDDEKLRLLAFEDRWHFIAVLCLKAMGTLDSDAPHLERRIALKLGLQSAQLDEVKRRLLDVGLIHSDWQPVKWDSRQYESDVSTDRVRRFRMKRKGNVSETDKNRTEQIQNRTETADAPPGLDAKAWDRWLDYRKQIRKPLKPASIPAAQLALAAFGTSQSAVVEQSIANGWQGLFALKTSTGKPVEDVGSKDRADLQKLADRRPAIGLADFREPKPGETAKDYRAAQDAEWNARKRRPVTGMAAAALKVLQ